MTPSSQVDREREVMRAAARSHWVLTWDQLVRLGFTRRIVSHWIATGQLIRLHRGVYGVGRRSIPLSGKRLAAVLAYGPGAALSHVSAAAEWRLLNTSQQLVDVSSPRRRGRRAGTRLHITRTLADEDMTVLDRIPITSVERTLVDLAGVRRAPQLLEAVEQACTIRALDMPTLWRVIERNANHRGVGVLRSIFDGFTGPPEVKSRLERLALHVTAGAGLPRPLLNQTVAGLQVDMYWPEWRLVIELDSVRWHSSPWAIERDRIRDIILRRDGQEVLRVTARRLEREPARVVDDIHALAAIGMREAARLAAST